MARDRVNVVIALDFKSADTLFKEGALTRYDKSRTIPESFKQRIADFMCKNTGFDTGPIFCLARINGDPVSLKNKGAIEGDIRIIDMLPISVGDVLIEFSIKADSVVSIGVNKLLELKSLAKEFGDDNDIVLDSLSESLAVGLESDDDNVYSFLPTLAQRDCISYLLVDDDWETSYREIFKGIEEVKIASLSMF